MWTIAEKLIPNTEDFELKALVNLNGFREYDARWLYPEQINLLGVQALGAGIATQIGGKNKRPVKIIVGHDYREYSMAVKQALINGLMCAGAHVFDIGMGITPMGYFARTYFNIPSIAMITASHNENGWTGVKIGATHPLTHGPEEMAELKEIVKNGKFKYGCGRYKYIPNIKNKYIAYLTNGVELQKKLRIVVATGNGTSGIFAPQALKRIGCDIIELHCNLDWNFPNYNPNPEDLIMLNDLKKKVIESKADIGFAFDGDGDRLGVVDEKGEEIFSDKMGLIVARWLSNQFKNSKFIIDVKSTGLFLNDPVLIKNSAKVEFWITGHSYIKQRVWEQKALAGFEKSGHFFFSEPIGKGYDDAILSSILVCKMLSEKKQSLSKLKSELKKTWQSPTMSPECPDEEKYQVVSLIRKQYENIAKRQDLVCGQKIINLITVNGVRVILEDGTWGLIRASSNKPSLVVVVESPVSYKKMAELFYDIDSRLKKTGKIGKYDQELSK